MWLGVLGHPVAVAVQLSLLGTGPVAGAEVFEARHVYCDSVGAGDVGL